MSPEMHHTLQGKFNIREKILYPDMVIQEKLSEFHYYDCSEKFI
jgi:hypothetical protein